MQKCKSNSFNQHTLLSILSTSKIRKFDCPDLTLLWGLSWLSRVICTLKVHLKKLLRNRQAMEKDTQTCSFKIPWGAAIRLGCSAAFFQKPMTEMLFWAKYFILFKNEHESLFTPRSQLFSSSIEVTPSDLHLSMNCRWTALCQENEDAQILKWNCSLNFSWIAHKRF